LEFKVDESSGETVVRVYRQHSEELIRQIPNEEAVALADKLSSEEPLMLFSAQV
jgi:flagellar protein FlaG